MTIRIEFIFMDDQLKGNEVKLKFGRGKIRRKMSTKLLKSDNGSARRYRTKRYDIQKYMFGTSRQRKMRVRTVSIILKAVGRGMSLFTFLCLSTYLSDCLAGPLSAYTRDVAHLYKLRSTAWRGVEWCGG